MFYCKFQWKGDEVGLYCKTEDEVMKKYNWFKKRYRGAIIKTLKELPDNEPTIRELHKA